MDTSKHSDLLVGSVPLDTSKTLVFYALCPKLLTSDKSYRIYLSRDYILGTWAGGQFCDKSSVRIQIGILYLSIIGIPIVESVARKIESRRTRLAGIYDKMIQEPFAFSEQNPDSVLEADPRNFFLKRENIETIGTRRNRQMWTGWTSKGALEIMDKNGHKLKLVLLPKQDIESVIQKLSEWKYHIT